MKTGGLPSYPRELAGLGICSTLVMLQLDSTPSTASHHCIQKSTACLTTTINNQFYFRKQRYSKHPSYYEPSTCTHLSQTQPTQYKTQLNSKPTQATKSIKILNFTTYFTAIPSPVLHNLRKAETEFLLSTIFIMYLINFCIMFYLFNLAPKVLDIPHHMPTPGSLIYFDCIFIVYSGIMILLMV